MDGLERLWTLLHSVRHCVAFTGAGISTLSGIRDFRGKKGIYKDLGSESIFDIQMFFTDPSFYYTATKEFIYELDKKEPSLVHRVLAELEKRRLLDAVITQNIDMLHQKAGSTQVLEIHGSPSIHYCPVCVGAVAAEKAVESFAASKEAKLLVRGFMDFKDVAEKVHAGDLPRCHDCGRVLKPAITFFGESLPVTSFRKALAHARSADLMLVLGTSLAVYPAASLPESVLNTGGKLVLVNDGQTHLDERAELVFHDLELVFNYLDERLQKG